MLFFRLICVVFIMIGFYIAINPLKVMNTFRVMFILRELDEDDFHVDFYRMRAIVGIVVISLLLLRSFIN